MSTDSLKEYWDALNRLKKRKPLNVPAGGRITNDQISLEAGRGRGSIKKSREIYSELITAIEKAEKERQQQNNKDEEKYERRRSEANKYKLLYQQSIAREISLARENEELKGEIKKLKKNNIHTITRESQA